MLTRVVMVRLAGVVSVTVAYALLASRSNTVNANAVPLTELMNDGKNVRPDSTGHVSTPGFILGAEFPAPAGP